MKTKLKTLYNFYTDETYMPFLKKYTESVFKFYNRHINIVNIKIICIGISM